MNKKKSPSPLLIYYGHIRKLSFFLHKNRIFKDTHTYLHTWTDLQPRKKSWHNLDNNVIRKVSNKYLENLLSKKFINGFTLESQDTKSISAIPITKRRYYSIMKALELVDNDDQLLIVTRPDVIHNKVSTFNKINLKDNQIACAFDLSYLTLNTGTHFQSFGCTDVVMMGTKKNIYNLVKYILENKFDNFYLEDIKVNKNNYSDYELHLYVTKKLGIEMLIMGYINERDFFIWRYKNRFRFKTIYSNFKDLIYSILKNTKKLFLA